MATIGELIAHIGADTSDLERGAKRSQKSLQSIDKGMQTTMGVARRLAGALGAIGIGFSLGASVRQVADFQVAMNGLAATSNATAQEMERLESQARELGATSKFSAQQAAEGQRFLAQAGFEVNEVLGATPGILKLATAAQLDLGTAADIASNVLGGMRLEVSELSRVNDVLAATASRSNTTIQQLGQALSFAAPFAAGAGIEIEEAAAAIGVMSDAGIQASRAGTGLVGTIRQLSKVTGDGEDILDKYGLSIEDVNIEARGLQPVLDTLRKANLNTADAIALFGSEAGAAAQVLVNDYTGGITNATGEADRMASEMESGLTPAFRSLGSAISESVLQMGDSGLAGALESVIETATGIISVYNGMLQKFSETNDLTSDQTGRLQVMADSLRAASGAAIALAGAYGLAATAAGVLTAATKILNAVLRVNPIIAIATAVIAVSGALYGARDAMVEFGDTTARVQDWLRGVWVVTSELFATSMGAAFDEVRSSFGGLTDYLGSSWDWMSTTFIALMRNIGGISKSTVNGVIAYFNTLGDVVSIIAKSMKDGFLSAFDNILNMARGFWQGMQNIFDGTLDFSAFNESLDKAFVNPMKDAAEEISASFKDNFSKDYLGDGIDWMGEAIRGFGEDISDEAFRSRFAGNEGEKPSGLPGALEETASKLMETNEQAGRLGDTTSSAADAMTGATTSVDRFANAATGAANRIANIDWGKGAMGTAAGQIPAQDNGMRSVRQRIEAGRDLSAYALEPNPSATRTWSTSAYDAAGSIPNAGMGRAANEAMQSSQRQSMQRIGELMLTSDKGSINVFTENPDAANKWLADTLSGNAAAS